MTCPGTNVGSDPHIFLITFAPLLDGTSFSAKKHAQFLRTTLECYALPIKKLFCLIGDDCSKNKATANEMFIPLLGCRSHRFNLAVESYISKNLAEESEMVRSLYILNLTKILVNIGRAADYKVKKYQGIR